MLGSFGRILGRGRLLDHHFRRHLHVDHPKFPQFLNYLETNFSGGDGAHGGGGNFKNLIERERQELMDLLEEMRDLNELGKDPEMKQEAEKDLIECRLKCDEKSGKIADFLLIRGSGKYDGNDAMMEFLPGAGGQEAALFNHEMYNCYHKYMTEQLGFTVAVQEFQTLEASLCVGLSKAVLRISGDSVFKRLKYECGVHRVQRIPVTGNAKILQTSTISIAVLPLPNASQMSNIPEKDLKFEFKRSSGAGGQSVNTSSSCARVTHIPSGIATECQEERTAEQNKKIAINKLKNMMFEKEFEKETKGISSKRKSQIGNMNRNEKIRTYNYTRNSITDHRIGETRRVGNITDFTSGSLGFEILQDFYNGLNTNDTTDQILELINS